MRKLRVEEIKKISGGSIAYTAAFIGAFAKVIDLLFQIGENLGSAIRRSTDSSICSIE